MNGDGFADLIVGAPNANSTTGRAYVYLGSATGLGMTPAASLSGLDGNESFGEAVAGAGDVNGDGFADLVVGAPSDNSSTGHAYVYLGSATGLSTTPATSLSGLDGVNGAFGVKVASAGDVNGDGFADLVVGASGANSSTGRVYVYLGSATGLGTTPATSLSGLDGVNGAFGAAVVSAGDVNGDGFADLVVGASGANSSAGRAYVYLGSATGLGTTPVTSLSGLDGNGGFGEAVAGAGDVNGDGFADLVVAAPSANSSTGRAYVYLGSATGLGTTPATSLSGLDGMYGGFGSLVAGAGDVNGDGFADLVVAAPSANSSAGRAYVYLGSATGLGTTPVTSLSGPDGGIFGEAVAGAGDVNGDGFVDLVVGAPDANSFTGRAYVYLGGATGLGTTPATSLSGLDGPNGGFGAALGT